MRTGSTPFTFAIWTLLICASAWQSVYATPNPTDCENHLSSHAIDVRLEDHIQYLANLYISFFVVPSQGNGQLSLRSKHQIWMKELRETSRHFAIPVPELKAMISNRVTPVSVGVQNAVDTQQAQNNSIRTEQSETLQRIQSEYVCSRTSQIVEVLQLVTKKSCEDITPDDLASITTLELSEKSISSLKDNDFNGLTALQTLDLFNNQLTDLPEGIFRNLTALRTLELSQNQLTNLPDGIFNDLTDLHALFLNYNQLTFHSDRTFKSLTALHSLELNGSQFASLPDGIFKNLTALQSLYLLDNPNLKLSQTIMTDLESRKVKVLQ